MPFADGPILPPPPAGAVPVLHNREYRVDSYHLAPDRLLIRGALRDQKPPGLLIPDDPEPITIHHMIVTLEVSVPEMVITEVHTEFEDHPQPECPTIIDHYQSLVGLSITRGFTHKVRELFGGPRGCSHTTALLQAMAPVAAQSRRGMEIVDALAAGEPRPAFGGGNDRSWERLGNTCHVWAEGGDLMAARRAGEGDTRPLTIQRRARERDD